MSDTPRDTPRDTSSEDTPTPEPSEKPMTDSSDITVVHLMRHGEVDNPDGVLYGRLAGYHLSELGRQMADRVAEHLADRDIT